MSISLNRAKTIAEVLTEALPYIQKFTSRTVVVKYGGNAMVDEKLKNSFARDIVLMKLVGMNQSWCTAGTADRRPAGKAQYRIELY